MVFAIHWHESATDLHVFTIPIPPPTSLSIPSLWVFPAYQPRALVSCIQPGLVICFTLDSILVSMLFSQNIPSSPSPTESQSLFCTDVTPGMQNCSVYPKSNCDEANFPCIGSITTPRSTSSRKSGLIPFRNL